MQGSAVLRLQDVLAARVRRRSVNKVRELLRPAPGLCLLDVGGGTGLVAEMLGGPWVEVV